MGTQKIHRHHPQLGCMYFQSLCISECTNGVYCQHESVMTNADSGGLELTDTHRFPFNRMSMIRFLLFAACSLTSSAMWLSWLVVRSWSLNSSKHLMSVVRCRSLCGVGFGCSRSIFSCSTEEGLDAMFEQQQMVGCESSSAAVVVMQSLVQMLLLFLERREFWIWGCCVFSQLTNPFTPYVATCVEMCEYLSGCLVFF
jgi:hypothetical protein